MTYVLFSSIANNVFESIKTASHFTAVRNTIPANHTIEYNNVDIDLIYRVDSAGNVTFVTGTSNTQLIGYVAQPGELLRMNDNMTAIGDTVILESDNTPSSTLSISFTSNVASYVCDKVVVDGIYQLPANSFAIVVEGNLSIPTDSGQQLVDSHSDIHIVNVQESIQEISGTGKLLVINVT